MQLRYPILQLLLQLQQTLGNLTDRQYTAPVSLLSGSTVGSHVRHLIEFYVELIKGYDSGCVNYDQRNRDELIESHRWVAMEKLEEIARTIARSDKELMLITDVTAGEDGPLEVRTNYFRELIYNLEHTVHHMALLRVGIGAVSSLVLPPAFGVAMSTLKFRQTCAQ
ncbi:MAG TPA: hypothetical protein VGN00_15355 [Puia sp.]|jgi:uncharacterized damage-inducible protein DinB